MKQCQIASIVWSEDHQDRLPMEVSNILGGTMEWVAGGNAFRHFQVMSNELSTAIVVWCPADTRRHATNFTTDFSNEKASYFVGLDAKKDNPRALLFGDRNITNGVAPNHTILTLETGQSAGWNRELHARCGNVAIMDGSVRLMSNADLQRMLREESGWTNRLALPE